MQSSSNTAAKPLALPARTRRRWRLRLTKKRVILTTLLLLVLVGGWFGFRIINNIQNIFHSPIISIFTTTKLKGEDVGRVNILLAGNSADDPGHDGANLTDSIMIISMDTKNHNAFMLSVPRDLWVDIPGYGHAKINEAYVDGETGGFTASGYPDGGMGLLEETLQQNFGMQFDYYALIDYNALRDAVDDVGGVDITINSSDPRGLYDPNIDWTTHGPLVKLSNGVHHLDGEQALDLARARGDSYNSYGFAGSDFDRTQHQRDLLLALRSKVVSAGTLANPLTMANLFDTLGRNVHTDITLSEVRRAYDLAKEIKSDDIQSVGLNDANGVNLLANYTSPAGQSALIPSAGLDDYSAIQAYITRLTTNNPVVREDASVVVLNGTDTLGLASQEQKALQAKAVTVSDIGDAAATTPTTTIIDASKGKMPATLALLKSLYGTHVTTTNPYVGTYTADFIVVLGADRVPAATTQ